MDRICGNRRRCQFYGCNRWFYGVEAVMKRIVFFLIGVLLGTAVVLAHAETIPATNGTYEPTLGPWTDNIGKGFSDASIDGLAAKVNGFYFGGGGVYSGSTMITKTRYRLNFTYNGSAYTNLEANTVATCPNGGSYSGSIQMCSGNTCPSGQGWTLIGSNCTRPDCPVGTTRQADGTCASPCPTYPPSTPDSLSATQPSNCSCPAGTSWYAYNGCRKTCGGNQPTGEVANSGFGIAIADGAAEGCFQGCLVQHKAGGYDQYKGYKIATATWSKWACNGNGLGTGPTPNDQPTPDAQTQDPSKKKDPPCAAGDGVITSSSGGVKCLPEGTPNTSKPSVEKKTKTETFPDNSTKTTTETTTRDPNTNATSVSTTTTSTGGQSGPAGTSTSQEGTTGKVGGGNGNGDGDGSCDPTLNFCGGPGTDGLYTKKEKTLESVFSTFQTTVKGSPIGSASTSFFAVSTPSGGCPGWSVTVPMLNITLDGSSFFCNGTVIQAMNAAGAVLLALATYIAFTWAFL